jgi:hypothetical protein
MDTNFTLDDAFFVKQTENMVSSLGPDGSYYVQAKGYAHERVFYKMCQNSYYNGTDQSCEACSDNCLDCMSNSTNCVSCHQGYQLNHEKLNCEAKSEDGGTPVWAIVLIVIGCVAIAAGVGFILYRRKSARITRMREL